MHTIGHHIDDALNLSAMELESSLSLVLELYVEAIEPIEGPSI